MRLIIDQGNSATKIHIANSKEIVETVIKENDELLEYVRQRIGDGTFKAAIYSSVRREYDKRLINVMSRKITPILCMGNTTHLPIGIEYRTPDTLGHDRIAAAVGAWQQRPGQPLLVVDAGTAITYDLVSAKGKFMGGNIAAGIEMRLRALHEQTGRLPRVSSDGELPLLGYDTETAIRAGALQGAAYELEGYITACEAENPGLLVFLTGGDAERLATIIKRTIFVDRNLVPKGLNCILDYNVEI
ncbi:MAG: type III pantothenate kinase [Bacteroidaceae bacterium]|nr:type III pantothenate kinase [Bacteroidaceae bacterium]